MVVLVRHVALDFAADFTHNRVMPSIKHPPADTSAPGPTARLPNFCNLGIMLRLLIIVNLLCLAAAVVRADGPDALQQYLRISTVAQPAIILSMLLAALALHRMPKQSRRRM